MPELTGLMQACDTEVQTTNWTVITMRIDEWAQKIRCYRYIWVKCNNQSKS